MFFSLSDRLENQKRVSDSETSAMFNETSGFSDTVSGLHLLAEIRLISRRER